jgi:hypothetical protein
MMMIIIIIVAVIPCTASFKVIASISGMLSECRRLQRNVIMIIIINKVMGRAGFWSTSVSCQLP